MKLRRPFAGCESIVLTTVANDASSFALASADADGFPISRSMTKMRSGYSWAIESGISYLPEIRTGLWFAIAGRDFPGAFAAANLQSQSAAAGLADLITLGNGSEVGYVGELINQRVAAPLK